MLNTSFISKFQIPLIYLLAGLLWIGLSDELLLYWVESSSLSPSQQAFLGTVKGYLYVVLTSLLLYFLIRNRTRALEASRADFRRLFEDSPNPMWIYDRETYRFVLVNKATTRQYGYSREEFLEQSIFDIRPEKSKARLKAYLQSDLNIYNDAGEWLHQSKSGHTFYVRITSHETTYEGRSCRLVTAMNINEKILAEMERRNVQKALNNAAMVCMCDLEGDILTVNNRFKRALGYEETEIIGRSCSNFHLTDVNPITWEDIWPMVRKGETWRSDVALLAKSGEKIWVDMVITPVENHEGEVYKCISVSYGISERKELETHRENLLADLAEYAFQTSHELRAPLARMLALITIVDDESEREFVLKSLKTTSHEMDHVIRKMNKALSRSSQNYILAQKNNGDKESSGN